MAYTIVHGTVIPTHTGDMTKKKKKHWSHQRVVNWHAKVRTLMHITVSRLFYHTL